jgi:hypothetical protein
MTQNAQEIQHAVLLKWQTWSAVRITLYHDNRDNGYQEQLVSTQHGLLFSNGVILAVTRHVLSGMDIG